MKKQILIFLTFALLFTLTACTNNNINSTTNYNTYEVQDTYPEIEHNADSITPNSPSGTISGNVYTNGYFGISYNADSDWKYFSKKEIAEIFNLAQSVAGDEFNNVANDASLIYDMYVADRNGLNNVNIILEKSSSTEISSFNITNNFRQLIPVLRSTFENMGYKNISSKISSAKLDEKTFDTLYTTAEINGIKMYQTQLMLKADEYIASITITTYYEDTTTQLLDNFSIIN